MTTQISTSAQQTTKVVALMPVALTMWAASRVPVYLDTPEMELLVQVNIMQRVKSFGNEAPGRSQSLRN